jgi:hypothetical protein
MRVANYIFVLSRPGTGCSPSRLSLAWLADVLSLSVNAKGHRMPSRVGLSTPRASRKVISDLRHPDQDQDHHARARAQTQTGGAAANQPFTSALSLRPTALRRRGSDGGSPRSARHNPNHHARSPSMDDAPSDPHPLRRSSTSAKTVRCDMGSTRPRLSRALSPSTPDLARQPNPPPPETTMPHRTVFAHEVLLMPRIFLASGNSFFFPHLRIIILSLGLANRHARRRGTEIWHLGHGTAPCQSALGFRFDPSSRGPLRSSGQGTARRPRDGCFIAGAEG